MCTRTVASADICVCACENVRERWGGGPGAHITNDIQAYILISSVVIDLIFIFLLLWSLFNLVPYVEMVNADDVSV